MNSTIFNFYQYNELLAAGGQPSAEQLAELKEGGFEAVVNLSPSSTRNYLPNEAQLTEELGMHLVHFPVDCSKLEELHFSMFKQIMQSLEGKKVFVHCGGNVKSSNLIHMYQVLEKGHDEEESLVHLKKIQQPEEKWFRYFKQFGMQGLN